MKRQALGTAADRRVPTAQRHTPARSRGHRQGPCCPVAKSLGKMEGGRREQLPSPPSPVRCLRYSQCQALLAGAAAGGVSQESGEQLQPLSPDGVRPREAGSAEAQLTPLQHESGNTFHGVSSPATCCCKAQGCGLWLCPKADTASGPLGHGSEKARKAHCWNKLRMDCNSKLSSSISSRISKYLPLGKEISFVATSGWRFHGVFHSMLYLQ